VVHLFHVHQTVPVHSVLLPELVYKEQRFLEISITCVLVDESSKFSRSLDKVTRQIIEFPPLIRFLYVKELTYDVHYLLL
jgi:hypothetical protein